MTVETEKKLIVAPAPHAKSSVTVKGIMWAVVLALLPPTIAGVYFFGVHALAIIIVCILSALLSEFIIQRLTKKPVTLKDGSAFITGLLLALVLPPSVPLWIPALGSFFAIAIVKHAFGGLGQNIFNPALAGRAFLVVSWPMIMTKWVSPFDAVTSATPLGIAKAEGIVGLVSQYGSKSLLYKSMFLGNIGGTIGETSALLLLIGGAFLLIKKIITWEIPVLYIGSVVIFSALIGGDPMLHLLGGGLIIGAFFMATDYVTGPLTRKGKLIFGLCLGLLTVIFRFFSGMPEGVMYSILLMNALTPMIDRYTRPRRFGK